MVLLTQFKCPIILTLAVGYCLGNNDFNQYGFDDMDPEEELNPHCPGCNEIKDDSYAELSKFLKESLPVPKYPSTDDDFREEQLFKLSQLIETLKTLRKYQPTQVLSTDADDDLIDELTTIKSPNEKNKKRKPLHNSKSPQTKNNDNKKDLGHHPTKLKKAPKTKRVIDGSTTSASPNYTKDLGNETSVRIILSEKQIPQNLSEVIKSPNVKVYLVLENKCKANINSQTTEPEDDNIHEDNLRIAEPRSLQIDQGIQNQEIWDESEIMTEKPKRTGIEGSVEKFLNKIRKNLRVFWGRI